MFSARYVDSALERPRWRLTANYRILRTLQIGVECNVAAREFGPLVTWYLSTESHTRPAVFLGTSSDRIGSPKGTQAYFLTVAKHVPRLPLSAYASLNYSEWDAGINFPFGLHVELPKNFSLRPMFDGDRTHLLLVYTRAQTNISLIYAWLESFGMAVAFGL